jgi:hypothetical protein
MGVPTWAISGLPLGSPEIKSHLDVGPVERCRVYYKGEGGGFPQVRAVVSLVCLYCPWWVLTPKMFQLHTNHLVWVLCRPMWVSEVCQLFLVPSWSSSMPFLPLKVLWAKECAPTPSIVFYLDSHLSLSRSWECVIRVYLWIVNAPKVLQLCTNQLVVWFVQVRVNNWPASHLS